MIPEQAVQTFLGRWARANQARDAEAAADLFLRDPAPLVTFSDGERTADWLDVRLRMAKDLARVGVERVETHDLHWIQLDEGPIVASFLYDLHVRDLWGTPATVTRLVTMTLARTKDGLRVASAHFSAPR